MLRDCCAGGRAALLPGRRIERSTGWASSSSSSWTAICFDAPPGHDRPAARSTRRRAARTHASPSGWTSRTPRAAAAAARRPPAARATACRRTVRLEFRDMRKFGRAAPHRGGPGAPAGALGPDAWRATGTRPISPAGCAGARRRSRPSCWTSGIWPASATSMPTRSCGGRAVAAREPAGSLVEEEIVLPGRGDPHPTGRRGAAAGLHALGLRRHRRGEQGSFQEWLQAYGRQGQECRRCGGHHGPDRRRGERHGVLSRLPAVARRRAERRWAPRRARSGSGRRGHKKASPE